MIGQSRSLATYFCVTVSRLQRSKLAEAFERWYSENMLSILRHFLFGCAIVAGCVTGRLEAASACVWKVTSPSGGTLYLGGSWHALRSSDYPLPSAYNRAFDASSRLAFEIDPKSLRDSSSVLRKAGEYPKGDSLKKHVDPRTYDYLRRFFHLLGVSEDKFSRYRPWYISILLETPSDRGLSDNLGVEAFFERRARANAKLITGLESLREHIEVFSGLSDRGSEAFLLITFIPADKSTADLSKLMSAWRRGDADFLASVTRSGFHDFPAMADRLLSTRNRNWIPQLEGYMRSGKIYFAVVGAAHMGGPDGIVALLRERGYTIEQL